MKANTRVFVLVEAGSAAYEIIGRLVFDWTVGDDIHVTEVGGGITIIPAERVIVVQERKQS